MENSLARSTTRRFQTFIASPSESNPGPKLALVAGTCTSTRSTGSKKLSCIRWMRDVWSVVLYGAATYERDVRTVTEHADRAEERRPPSNNAVLSSKMAAVLLLLNSLAPM